MYRAKRWIGWKARPLLRARYGSEDDAERVAGAQVSGGEAAFSTR